MNNIEIWRPIVGREGQYEVSSHGRVRSVDRVEIYQRRDQYSGRTLTIQRKLRSKILRPAASKGGHLHVSLGATNPRLVHQLVLEAFIGPRPPSMEGLHGDGKPANNRVDNLRWGTSAENHADALRHGTILIGEAHPASKLTEADVAAIWELLETTSITATARQFGVSGSVIRSIKHGNKWKHVTKGRKVHAKYPGEYWAPEEEAKLREGFSRGMSLPQLAIFVGRRMKGVELKTYRLGLKSGRPINRLEERT